VNRPVDTVLVRHGQHEPSAVCHEIHCYVHNVDEPGPGYLGCGECFHLYRTVGELRRAYRATMWRATRGDLWLFMGDAWHWSWWRFLWHLLTVRAGKIYSCPHCSHDF
jgi:hypothetical protein